MSFRIKAKDRDVVVEISSGEVLEQKRTRIRFKSIDVRIVLRSSSARSPHLLYPDIARPDPAPIVRISGLREALWG